VCVWCVYVCVYQNPSCLLASLPPFTLPPGGLCCFSACSCCGGCCVFCGVETACVGVRVGVCVCAVCLFGGCCVINLSEDVAGGRFGMGMGPSLV